MVDTQHDVPSITKSNKLFKRGENFTVEKKIQCSKYNQPRSIVSWVKMRKKTLNRF